MKFEILKGDEEKFCRLTRVKRMIFDFRVHQRIQNFLSLKSKLFSQ
ncbi:unknown protein [Parachlamydia acanthamoebae UV-7]|uniref:Uncharacterized protein n=2 Tax=Parachlamydia acanthamoebae TaxID=83552 RepID=F8KUZ0_PARAV|nr:hypothetical protein DB43_AG00130 [Parachlamydia acanthamoebae]CCB85055.1 unknown protein [Parachlamydia acanthamoebae UV-7]